MVTVLLLFSVSRPFMAVSASDAAALASSDEELTPAGSHPSAQPDYSDARLERVAAYTTTTMRLKPEKWAKMMAHDEFRVCFLYFCTVPTNKTGCQCSISSWTGCTDGHEFW